MPKDTNYEEEIDDKNDNSSQGVEDEEESKDDTSLDNDSDSKDDKSDDDKSKDQKSEDNIKERNRKGYEMRQQKKADKGGNQPSEIDSVKEEVSDLKFLRSHPEITDETFNIIKAQAKGSGKSYEDTLKEENIQIFIKEQEKKGRVDRATADPSSRTSSGGGTGFRPDMSSAEFQEYQNKVLER